MPSTIATSRARLVVRWTMIPGRSRPPSDGTVSSTGGAGPRRSDKSFVPASWLIAASGPHASCAAM
jgi:hypothetical protein